MSASIERVKGELIALGYETECFLSSQGPVVAFKYEIEAGSHKGELITVGLSFQEEGYPEYPPHWIHVTPPLDDGRGGSIQHYHEPPGREWLAMSRPPGPKWDRLATKTIHAFISEHLRCIWAEI